MNDEKITYTGSISIAQAKPNYNVTFTNGEKTLGRIDMNGEVMTFEGDADASAKKFMDYLAQYFSQRLKEEREKEREACAKIAENGLIGHTIAKAIRARGDKHD